MAEKAQFTGVNEHFEAIFNAAEATQIVFQQPASFATKREPIFVMLAIRRTQVSSYANRRASKKSDLSIFPPFLVMPA